MHCIDGGFLRARILGLFLFVFALSACGSKSDDKPAGHPEASKETSKHDKKSTPPEDQESSATKNDNESGPSGNEPRAEPPSAPQDYPPSVTPPPKIEPPLGPKAESHHDDANDFYARKILGALGDGRIIYFQRGEGLVAKGGHQNEILLKTDSVEGVYPYGKIERLVGTVYTQKLKDFEIPEVELGLLDSTGKLVKTFGEAGWARLRTTENYTSVHLYDALEMPSHEIAILWTSTVGALPKDVNTQGHLTFLSEKGQFSRAVIFPDAELLEQARLIIDGQQVVVVSLGTPNSNTNLIFKSTTSIRLRRFQISPAKGAGDIVYGFLENCNMKLDRGSETMLIALYQCEADRRLWGMRIDGQFARTSATKFALPFTGGVIYPSIVPLANGDYALMAFKIHEVKLGIYGEGELLGAKLNRDFTLESWLIPLELSTPINTAWVTDLNAEAFALGEGRIVFGEHDWHFFNER